MPVGTPEETKAIVALVWLDLPRSKTELLITILGGPDLGRGEYKLSGLLNQSFFTAQLEIELIVCNGSCQLTLSGGTSLIAK
jgi:hypothetical protein